MAYFSYTRPDALAVAMDASTTTVELVDGSSLPDPAMPGIGQYTVIIGYGVSREEVCTVTAKPANRTLTVVRGEDGTLAIPKNQGDIVVHGVSARDFNGMLNLSGGQMTGPLLLKANPVADLEAVPRAWVLEQIAGATSRKLVRIGADTTLEAAPHTDYLYVCVNTTPIRVTLPTAVGNTCRYTIKRRGVEVQIWPPSGESVDGTFTPPFTLEMAYQSFDLVADGNGANAGWMIV